MAEKLRVPFCPTCKEKRDGKFCSRCGAACVEGVIHCTNCDNADLWPHEKFCPECGTAVSRG
jgi:hypothetical protein